MNYFETLNGINVSNKTEKKSGLTYLSWAWAWGEVKKLYPHSFYTVYENKNEWNYFTDGITGWVKTGVTVVVSEGNQIEHIEYLPIMDFKNKSIVAANITSFDVNKAIQRSLTKAIARHGLGLYIYAGEDLPEDEPKKNDASTPTVTSEEDEIEAIKHSLVDKVQIATMQAEMMKKGVKTEVILEAYSVKALAELTKENFVSVMKRLEKTKVAE